MLFEEFGVDRNFVGAEVKDRSEAGVGRAREKDERFLKSRNGLATTTSHFEAIMSRFSSFSVWWVEGGHSYQNLPPSKERI